MENAYHAIVKICGIARVEDGLAALEAGADWLGFIRWEGSKRFRPLQECADLLGRIRAEAGRRFQAVGVYVDAPLDSIRREVDRAGFDRVQFHGDETMETIRQSPIPAIKAIKISDAESIARADDFPGVDLLTDTADPSLPGGTGRGYDVALLGDLARRRRVIVAGGLRPENVGEVVSQLRPFGVDVSSGVEQAPGIKDAEKVRAFVRAVREAEAG